MFNKKKKKTPVVDNTNVLVKEQFLNLQVAQDALLIKLQTRNTDQADMAYCPPIDFKDSPIIKYTDGVFLQDLTTDEQTKFGLSIFHARIEENTSSPIHKHGNRYQIVFVRKGKVIDNTSDEEYTTGETFCIRKKENHSIKYMKGSEVILISIPGLALLMDSNLK